jgi:hypothetical protein
MGEVLVSSFGCVVTEQSDAYNHLSAFASATILLVEDLVILCKSEAEGTAPNTIAQLIL